LACHAAALVGDFNGDGRLDFAVGNHFVGNRASTQGQTWLTIWWNKGPSVSLTKSSHPK
jgi:hypothetical protein